MHVLITQHFPDLPIRQRRLKLTHLPRNLRTWTFLLQELLCRSLHRDRIICCIKDLEAQPALLDSKVTNLTQIACVNIAPSVALSRRGVVDVSWEIPLVFMGLNDVAYPQSVDVILVATCKCTSCFLATYL